MYVYQEFFGIEIIAPLPLFLWYPLPEFVVQPRNGDENTYGLIAEAYVHGRIYGEVFDLVTEDAFETMHLEGGHSRSCGWSCKDIWCCLYNME